MNCAQQLFHIKQFELRDYSEVWQEMQAFTAKRTEQTQDELWLLQHNPVFTLGLAGKKEHLLNPGSIPVVQSDRGGQVTYHGPGQLIAYVMYDLQRAGIGVRRLVELLQSSVIDLLQQHAIKAHTLPKAPGVYVENKKIAAIGLRVRHGRSFHGLSLNVDMDLEPFSRINPCGYPQMEVTQMRDLGIEASMQDITEQLNNSIQFCLGKK
jgi:lipoyl(octanoyl) transferase